MLIILFGKLINYEWNQYKKNELVMLSRIELEYIPGHNNMSVVPDFGRTPPVDFRNF